MDGARIELAAARIQAVGEALGGVGAGALVTWLGEALPGGRLAVDAPELALGWDRRLQLAASDADSTAHIYAASVRMMTAIEEQLARQARGLR